ncbi:MAG TPA: kelch repeat-containing protein [Chthoniobacterales bacterium]|nr:kelch repeat-containing protein [Chthoniobacterales bacterium]
MKVLPAGVIFSLVLAAASDGQTVGGTWQQLAPMSTDRQELASALLNGKIYVMGGLNADGVSTNTVEVYNPATNSWTSAQPLPLETDHNNAAVAAGKLYSLNGIRTYLYDPVGNSWSQVATMNFAHGRTAAVGVINDKIYVAGGMGTGMTQRELEVFDPLTNTWTNRAPMSVGRNHCAGGVINGKFYVVGGRDTPEALTALEVYDPQANSWQTRAPMPTGRSGIAAAVVHGELYVFGGEIGTGVGTAPRAEVEAYNPASNSWRRVLPDMPNPRHGIWASVIGNKIYLAGGGEAKGLLPTNYHDVFIVNTKATFANISTRLKVESGENALIGGFIVTGTASKRVLLRAIGPSLPISGALNNPRLELYNGAGQLVAANGNWRDAPNEQEIIDSSIPPSHDLESAILTTVAPGNHTAVVRGENDATGIALVEVYDLEAGSDTKLANISTRGFVQTGEDVLIGGLILTGHEPRRVIVRAIGPSLARPDALADPALELRDANGGLLASNDNWRTSQEGEIIATTIPPSNDLESAIVQTLPPANYTAIVQGQGAATGIALVEAYALE